jgi:hypothetical protein
MRLIDADALDRKIVEMTREPAYQHTGESWLNGLCMAMEAVNTAPTIDAVEVVRCRDCEKRDKDFVSAKGTISCPYMEAFMPPDGFCSYGEKRCDDAT